MEIRVRDTGQVMYEDEFRALHPSTSFPPQLTVELLNDFGADPVLEGPQATGGEFWQYSMRQGVERDGEGRWFTKYVLGPIFSDPAEQAAYIAQKTAEKNKALQESIVAAAQKRLDDFAQTRNYDDIKSACDYAGCSVQKFSVEGQYCKDKRAETWLKLYQMLGEVEAGTRPMPTSFADVEPELPALEWPL